MTQYVGFLKRKSLLWIIRRGRGHGPDHWSVVRKKKTPKDKALEHFNDFYSGVYGAFWPSIRSALLKKTHKYIAVVNNFADNEKIIATLQLQGAMDVKQLYEVMKTNKEESVEITEIEEPLEPISELKMLNSDNYEYADEFTSEIEEYTGLPLVEKPHASVQLRPLEEDLAIAKVDESRIIEPFAGVTASSLYEYIPATKLKGLDDYVFESAHYEYYSKSADFEIKVEKDSSFSFPEHLKIFTFEAGNYSSFPSPRKQITEIFDYYLMDGGSILPVLALDLHPGDVVLDMCAAPGGKSLVALQTLYPNILVANDSKLSRVNMINTVFKEYLGNIDAWNNRLFVTNKDARNIEDRNVYNKILVDVPCTTDRHSLHENENNIFSPGRIKERLRFPEFQSSILIQALRIIPIGGTVVYSTCSLSPIQNDGVVQMALKKNWEETKTVMIVKDTSEWLKPLNTIYKFGNDFGFKFGSLVVPTSQCNFGPTYFSKIVRVQ